MKVEYKDNSKDMNRFLLGIKYKNKSKNLLKCLNKYKITIINKLVSINSISYLMMGYSKHLKPIVNQLLDFKIKTLQLTIITEINQIVCHFTILIPSSSLTRKKANTSH